LQEKTIVNLFLRIQYFRLFLQILKSVVILTNTLGKVEELEKKILLMQKKLLFISFKDKSLKERGIVSKTLNTRVIWTQEIKII